MRPRSEHLPLMKHSGNPALSTSLPLRASKQAGPWWIPGDSRILRSASASEPPAAARAANAQRFLDRFHPRLGGEAEGKSCGRLWRFKIAHGGGREEEWQQKWVEEESEGIGGACNRTMEESPMISIYTLACGQAVSVRKRVR